MEYFQIIKWDSDGLDRQRVYVGNNILQIFCSFEANYT